MKKEDHKKIINEILNSLDDQGKVSELLVKLEDDNSILEDKHLEASTKIDSLIENNESLRSANNKLFIRLGAEEAQKQPFDDPTPTDQTDQTEDNLKFEDLFNSKGELI